MKRMVLVLSARVAENIALLHEETNISEAAIIGSDEASHTAPIPFSFSSSCEFDSLLCTVSYKGKCFSE